MSNIGNWQALYSPGHNSSGNAPFLEKNIPTTKVELSIACRNLLDCDIISKSDPQCILYLKDGPNSTYQEIGKTEVIYDTLNPDFVKKFNVDYNFESVQYLKFEIWDIDLSGKDFLGQFETTLADIVAHKGTQFVGQLTGKSDKNCGKLLIVVEEVSASKQVATIHFRGRRLKKTCWLCKPDPFLLIWKSNEDGSYSVVHKTETCRSTKDPDWNSFSIKARSLCNGDYDRNIRIDCLDYRFNGNHCLIGSFFTTLSELIARTKDPSQPRRFQLTNNNITNGTNLGEINLVSLTLEAEVSFLDYIRSGTEMHFAVAIDFTASNGDVRDPNSLHYISSVSGSPNAYEVALRAVGQIIQHYDTRGMFPGFGFGAKLTPDGQVSHQFPLNGNAAHPYCRGIDELLSAYKSTLSQVTLYGPTNFAPVINSTASIASQYQDGKNYFVLLIITDGIICDMYQTKLAIISASRLPISIIIVGVGNADFSAMDELDSDNVILSVDGKTADRDIVQFVAINKFLGTSGSWIQSQHKLAKEVLYEIPDQIVSYMTSKGFKPTSVRT